MVTPGKFPFFERKKFIDYESYKRNQSERAYDFTSVLVEKLWSTENPSKRVKTLLRKIKEKLKVFLITIKIFQTKNFGE